MESISLGEESKCILLSIMWPCQIFPLKDDIVPHQLHLSPNIHVRSKIQLIYYIPSLKYLNADPLDKQHIIECLKLKNKKKWKKFKRKKPIPYYIGIQIWILLLCQQLHKCDKHNQDRPSRKKNDHILPHLLLCVHQLKDWHQYPSMNLN